MHIGVLGLGNFGTALAQHLSSHHEQVRAWTRDASVVASIAAGRRNPSYLSDTKLNKNIKATTAIQEMHSCDILVFALPAKAINTVAELVQPKNGALVISAVKGIDQVSGQTALDCLKGRYKSTVRYGVLSGPGFAKDLVAGLPAGVVAAAVNDADCREIGSVFSQGNLRVYLSNDPIGVEFGGIVKNVVAIAAGIVDGLGLGDSARAGIITRGLAEMTRLAVAAGANAETLSGLSGLGDLVLTATCDASRNRQVGLGLGRGEKLVAVVDSLGSVAEGVHTTPLLLQIAKSLRVEMPIAEQVQAVLLEQATPAAMVASLMSRPIKYEFHE